MDIKKRKLVKYIIFFSFIMCAFVLCGCNEMSITANTLETLSNNMSKITNTLDNVQNIDNSELIITDFMNETELSIIDSTKMYDSTLSTDAMSSYMTKITTLNNNVISTVNLNTEINNTKKQIYAKTSYVKSLCNQNKDSKASLTESELKSLKELNSTLMANNTRISLSRNEITNNFNIVKKDQANYSSKPEYLASKYTKLQTSLNTRLSYFKNLSNGLSEVADILCSSSNAPYICDDYIFDDEKSEIDETNTTKEQDTQTTSLFTKNIDTYENAGTNMYGDIRNNPVYNQDNYLKNINPGYGMSGYNMYGGMPYSYGMGGYGMGYGGINNYGMPFGNGYMFPNINTFGTYKNIDTYRSRNNLDQQTETQQDEPMVTTETAPSSQKPIQKPYPMPRPEPMPRPYPTERPLPKVVDNASEEDLSKKPMPLPNFDEDTKINEPEKNEIETANIQTVKPENAKNDEEQFVDNQDKPKIEKIVDGDCIIYKIEI